MKPKKQVALKLKTLTLTLGLVAGMSAGTAMGYTAKVGGDGEKVQQANAGIEAFLADYVDQKYISPKVDSSAGTDADKKGVGVYSAAGYVTSGTAATGDVSPITGTTNLTNVVMKRLHAGAVNLTGKETAVTSAYDATAVSSNAKLKALNDLLGDIDEDAGSDGDNASIAMALLTAIDAGVVETPVANFFDTPKNYSDATDPVVATTDKARAAAIDALNETIDDIYQTFKTAGLTTEAQRTALFNYMAAYLDYSTPEKALTAKTKSQLIGDSNVDLSKFSDLAKTVVALFDNSDGDSKAQDNLDNNIELYKLATDDQLVEVTTAGYLEAKLALIDNANSEQGELVKLFASAKSATDTAKKATLVNEVVEKLVPNARSTFGAVSGASKTVTGNVGDHLKVMQAGGVNSGDSDYADGNVWLRMNYLQQTVDAQDAAPGYKQKSMGFGIGVDQPLNDKFTMGLAYNFVRSDVDGEDGYLREDDVKSHGFGGYVTMMHDNLFADAQINYVKNKVDGFRKITTDASKITYKYDADVLNAMIGLGMHVDLENHWYAKPKLCFAFANHKTDKYDEEGSTLVSTDIDAASHQSSEVGLQLTVGADLMMDNYKVMPKLNMGFMYDMNDKKDKVTFAFMGDNSFVAEGPKRDRSNFNLGVGAGFMMENVTLSLDYGFNWSSNTKTHGISAKLGCMF